MIGGSFPLAPVRMAFHVDYPHHRPPSTASSHVNYRVETSVSEDSLQRAWTLVIFSSSHRQRCEKRRWRNNPGWISFKNRRITISKMKRSIAIRLACLRCRTMRSITRSWTHRWIPWIPFPTTLIIIITIICIIRHSNLRLLPIPSRTNPFELRVCIVVGRREWIVNLVIVRETSDVSFVLLRYTHFCRIHDILRPRSCHFYLSLEDAGQRTRWLRPSTSLYIDTDACTRACYGYKQARKISK